MRPALLRLLTSQSALRLLRQSLEYGGFIHQATCSCRSREHIRRRSSLVAGTWVNDSGSGDNLAELERRRHSGLPVPWLRPKERKATQQTKQSNKKDFTELEKILYSHIPLLSGETRRTPQDDEGWKFCLELVQSERRLYEGGCARQILNTIMGYNLDIPTSGTIADELWENLVQLGFEDREFLERVICYAEQLKARTKCIWHSLYASVMVNVLRTQPTSALEWHRRLCTTFPPSLEDYRQFFDLSMLWGQQSLTAFKEIYTHLPILGMYSVVIPGLCLKSQYRNATQWHYVLLKAGDTPRDFQACKHLLQFHSRINNDMEVENLVVSLTNAQVWFEKSVDRLVRKNKVIGREILNRALGEAYGIAPKSPSDRLCARFFATKMFPVDLVIDGLHTFGAEKIGPLSLREIVVRDECIGAHICEHLDKLRKASIALDDSKYSRMIRKAALANHTRILRSIVYSDLHPETFDDPVLQERLLAKYQADRDHDQMRRTLEILLESVPHDEMMVQRSNILLRCYISNRYRDKTMSLLEKMFHNNIPLTSRSAIAFRYAYLVKRNVSKRPRDSQQGIKDLMILIKILQNTMQSSREFVPINAWREILRRLGMLGQLTDYQNLALWLVDHYTTIPPASAIQEGSNTPFLSYQASGTPSCLATKTQQPNSPTAAQNEGNFTFSYDDQVSRPANSHVTATKLNKAARQPETHLLTLFNVRAQQAMIAWGFQSEIKGHANLLMASEKRLKRSSPDWQWGLRLLKLLQMRGVPIDKSAVAKACKQRLLQLFAQRGQSNRIVNRRAKALNQWRAKTMSQYTYPAYVKGMEEIWGEDLFQSGKDWPGNEIHGAQGKEWKILRSHEPP